MVNFDPIRAAQAGRESANALFDTYARSRAGSQMAGGNAVEAANTLARFGMIEDASALQKSQVETAEAARTARIEDEEDDAKWLTQGAQGLLQVPYEQRRSVYQAQIRPRLESRLSPEDMARVDAADLSDAELRAIVTSYGGEVPSLTAGDRAGRNGEVIRADPYTGAYAPVYTPAFDPREGASPGFMWEDETRTSQIPIRGSSADPEYIARVAGVRRDAVVDRPAPSRARSGGGSRSSGGSSATPSRAAPAGRPWERY